MIKILIAGCNSYIGTSFDLWSRQYPDKYSIDTIDMIDGTWEEQSFSGYNVIFHVAGIAHIKETKENKDLYFRVNRDLAFAVAKKSKEENVKHFIYLSSMSVYGLTQGMITMDTKPNPKSNYGQSKLEAEQQISALQDNDFLVSILRPPMVYGRGCKGNFQNLKKLMLATPIFPKINNSRSMIFIDNLCEFVRLVIDNQIIGILYPQNSEYVCTSSMAKMISRKTLLFGGVNGIVRMMCKRVGIISKIFGDLTYEKSMSDINLNYNLCDFPQTIQRSL